MSTDNVYVVTRDDLGMKIFTTPRKAWESLLTTGAVLTLFHIATGATTNQGYLTKGATKRITSDAIEAGLITRLNKELSVPVTDKDGIVIGSVDKLEVFRE